MPVTNYLLDIGATRLCATLRTCDAPKNCAKGKIETLLREFANLDTKRDRKSEQFSADHRLPSSQPLMAFSTRRKRISIAAISLACICSWLEIRLVGAPNF